MIPRPTTITEECSCGATFKVTSHLAIGAAGDWRRNHKCRGAVPAEDDDSEIRTAKAIGWELGYLQGVQDAERDVFHRADNPYLEDQ